jgi:aldose 1-epimerase
MVDVFRLSSPTLKLEFNAYGARMTRCVTCDAAGDFADVVPGMDSADDYRRRGGTMGAIVGRYANRISHGRIHVDDAIVDLDRNDDPHTMHGGSCNFSKRMWHGEQRTDAVRFQLSSPDGDQGWPGNVKALVEYRLLRSDTLLIEMSAVSDRTTYMNMLFHGYWNLGGHDSGSVLDHHLRIAADHYLPKSHEGLPTGEILHVGNTPFDFTGGKELGCDIAQVGRGYGHNLCLRDYQPGRLSKACVLNHTGSGRSLTIETDQPGLQLFTANLWDGLPGKGGVLYRAHDAVALETQLYPNSPNTPTFNPSPLRAGQQYRHRMVLTFGPAG